MASTPLLMRWSAPPPVAPHDHYLTDGSRLFRVVCGFDPRAQKPLATLEDCLTLSLETHSPVALASMQLRVVIPASGD